MARDYSKLKVLIVEDHPFMRTLLRDVLVSLGFALDNIREASDGEQALAILRHQAADIAISDWCMAPMDGITFLRKIRDRTASPAPNLRVIMCSGHTERKMVEDARDAGADEILGKPITAQALETHLRSVIENPREYVTVGNYFGPDRRRRGVNSVGPERRKRQG